MLGASNTPIADALPYFTRRGVDVTFLVPTATGHSKSIMDATTPFRQFLLRNDLHDYERQGQGPQAKERVPAEFVLGDDTIPSMASLYRPVTKQGDPRVWFDGLKEYARATDLLAIATDGRTLFVFNMSSPAVLDSLRYGGVADKLLDSLVEHEESCAEDLLKRLRDVYRMGFIPTVIPGDTGVGMTLESVLGIPPNCSELPDYQGIEIKAGRVRPRAGLQTLFAKVPDWTRSELKSATEVLDEYGYMGDGRFQLYCTVGRLPNPQSLFLAVDDEADVLHTLSDRHVPPDKVVLWGMDVLRAKLEEKHRETFWVKADARYAGGREEFLYKSVLHTRKPNVNQMGTLLGLGAITVDFVMHRKPGGGTRDHGWLFRMNQAQAHLLFPQPREYDLSAA